MANWIQENDRVKIENKPKSIGCVYYFLSAVGIFLILISLLIILSSIEGSQISDTTLIGIGLFLFGSVFFLAGFSPKMMNFNYLLIIDKMKQEVSFTKDEKDLTYRISFGELSFIRLIKVMKSHNSESSHSHSYPTYQIFLVKNDGAHFWVDTFTDTNSLIQYSDVVYKLIGIPVKDETGMNISKPATEFYKETGKQVPDSHSEFVKLEESSEGEIISIIPYTPLINKLLLFLVFGLFTFAPCAIGYSIIRESLVDSQNPMGFIPLIFFIPFAIIFFSVLGFLFLLQFKIYTIQLNKHELVVEMKFRLSILQKMFGKKINIPSEMIRYIRVNRLDEGNFWLSLVVDEIFKLPIGFNSFVFNLGVFRKDTIAKISNDEKIIGLWEIAQHVKKGCGADFSDLHFIENKIEQTYDLYEKTVTL